jgi:hypothetical protein
MANMAAVAKRVVRFMVGILVFEAAVAALTARFCTIGADGRLTGAVSELSARPI